jgi:hypothetical protein
MTTQPAGEHHTGTLNLAGEGNPNCPLAPHHHLMETCDCGYAYEYPTPDNEHRPIGVRSTDIGPFIRCSCGSNPTPHYWLRAHWPGDKAEGERLLQELAREIGGAE